MSKQDLTDRILAGSESIVNEHCQRVPGVTCKEAAAYTIDDFY